jgi:hypothetical protein
MALLLVKKSITESNQMQGRKPAKNLNQKHGSKRILDKAREEKINISRSKKE